MHPLLLQANDPTTFGDTINPTVIAVIGVLSLILAFSDKLMELIIKIRDFLFKRQRREEKLDAITERMETMLKQMHTITQQQHDAMVNHKLQLQLNERWEKQIAELEKGIEECQKEVAYLRGKTDKP